MEVQPNRLYTSYGLNTLWGGDTAAGGFDPCTISELDRPEVTPFITDRGGSLQNQYPFAYVSDPANNAAYADRARKTFCHGQGDQVNVLRAGGAVETLTEERMLGETYPLFEYDTWRPTEPAWGF